MSNEKFKVKFGLAVGDTAATVDGSTGDIVTNGDIDVKGSNVTNSTGALILTSTGANNVQIDPGSGTTTNDGHMVLGQFNTNAILSTNGTGALDIRTGSYPTSANINLASGTNGNITVDTDGTGQVIINADVDINGNLVTNGITGGNVTVGVVDDQTISTITGDLNIFPASASRMYLETADVDPIFAVRNTSNTTQSARALTLRADSTGTPGVGFGTLLDFEVENSTGGFPRAGYVGVYATDVTAGNENFKMGFGLMKNGAFYAERMNLDNDGNLQIDGDLTVTGTNIGTGVTDTIIKLDRTSATTNNFTRAAVLTSTSTGTPAVGFGTALGFNSQTDATTFKDSGYISVQATDITAGSEDFSMNFGLMEAGTAYNTKLTLNSLGNLIPVGNLVKGNIRNTVAEAAGNIFSFSTTASGGPTRGISIDNSIATAQRAGIVMRSYGGGLPSGNPVTTFITETARGSAATPAGLSSGNGLGSFIAGGYADTSVSGTDAGWVSDTTGNTAAGIFFQTTEAWTGGTGALSPLGTRVRIQTNPTGSANAIQTSLEINPQSTLHRSDAFTWSNGKTGTTQTMALDVNGNLTLTGDLRVNGNDIQSSAGTTALTLNGASINTPGNITAFGTATFDTITAIDAQSNLLSTNNGAGTSVNIKTNYRTGSGGTLVVPQANNALGNFRFESYSDTAGTYVLGGSVQCSATENFTSTANGTKVIFTAVKQGKAWNDGTFNNVVLSVSPDSSVVSSDVITLQNSNTSATNYATFNSTGLTLNSNLDVQGGTITDSTGALTISTGASDGAITLDPNGTGDVILTFANGGNLTNSRNYVYGAIRNATTETNGDQWSLLAGAGSAYRGISLDNSIDTTKRVGTTLRSYGISGGAPRTGVIFEGARGSAATPANLNSGDVIGDLFANGYTSTGWATDLVNAVPGTARFYTTEAWNNGLNNVGTGFRVILQPTATAMTTSSVVTALEVTPAATTVTKILNVIENRATNNTEYARTNFTTARFSGGSYSPTQSGDPLGEFKFNGNSQTGGSFGVPGGPGALVTAKATELWSNTANGTKFFFNAIKTGTINSYDVITGTPDQVELNAVTTSIKDYDGVATFATFDSTAATLTKPLKLNGSTSGSVTLSAGATPATQSYTLPQAYPAGNDYRLVSTTGGVMSWAPPGTGFARGSFIYTGSVTGSTANTSTILPLNTTLDSGITLDTSISGTGTITVAKAGIYAINLNVQVNNTSSGQDHVVFFWLRKNGSDVAYSATDYTIIKSGYNVASLNFLQNAAVNDTFELWYQVDNAALEFTTIPATTTPTAAIKPVAPSIVVNLTQVG